MTNEMTVWIDTFLKLKQICRPVKPWNQGFQLLTQPVSFEWTHSQPDQRRNVSNSRWWLYIQGYYVKWRESTIGTGVHCDVTFFLLFSIYVKSFRREREWKGYCKTFSLYEGSVIRSPDREFIWSSFTR